MNERNTNNPPDVILELTMDEAKFLLENCNTNMEFGLRSMMAMPDANRETLEKLVNLNEKFKTIRNKLLRSGVKND